MEPSELFDQLEQKNFNSDPELRLRTYQLVTLANEYLEQSLSLLGSFRGRMYQAKLRFPDVQDDLLWYPLLAGEKILEEDCIVYNNMHLTGVLRGKFPKLCHSDLPNEKWLINIIAMRALYVCKCYEQFEIESILIDIEELLFHMRRILPAFREITPANQLRMLAMLTVDEIEFLTDDEVCKDVIKNFRDVSFEVRRKLLCSLTQGSGFNGKGYKTLRSTEWKLIKEYAFLFQ